ncbi:hypothetical protein D3C78_1284460 [compost metagenome]
MLGFRGQLRGERGQALHERWRRALFNFAWQREPAPQGALRSLARPTQAQPLRLPLRRTLPDGFRLTLVIIAGGILLTVIGHGFWRDIQSELEPVMHLAEMLDERELPE